MLLKGHADFQIRFFAWKGRSQSGRDPIPRGGHQAL